MGLGLCYGWFEYGGNPINWYAPTLVDNNNKWIAVSAGITRMCGHEEDGTLWGWGFNAHGELGSSDFDGYTDFTECPFQICDDRWIAVSAGNYFTVGLKEDGSLWAWGWNKMGQLGDGTTVDKHVPTRVGSDGDSWLAAAAGLNHVVAIKADGSLWAWGGNEYGELGNGSYDGIVDPPPHPVPAQIGTDTDWIFVSTGDSHNAAFKTDGSLWLWGLNGTGQLGDGTSGTAKTVPQRLDGAGTWLAVACGGSHTVATLEAGLTVPTVPQNFTATPGDTQVELTWEAPASDGGAAITHYEVSADDGTTWVTASTSTSHTFTGLTNGTEYTFKVRAVNSEGHGDAASVTATPCATSAGDFAGGSGTEEDPYLISTVAHLDNVRNYLDKHFKLTANLDLSVYGGEEGWEPIGTGTDPFTGYFDGDGHTISNLFIDRITEPRIGLFGYTGDTADIRDISLEDVRVTGDFYVGGLVGWNEGVIASAWVTGDVTGRSETGGLVGVNHGLITESWVEGTVTDVWGGDIGGLVAENYDRISNCHADAVVSSVSSFAGGLAGSNYGIINTSYAAGSVEGSSYVGGLVGLNSEGSIDTCYATGDANGTEDWINYTFVGGLVGLNRGSISNSYAREMHPARKISGAWSGLMPTLARLPVPIQPGL